jgi:coenzyme F420-0:L-glutamate ligase / coenzyme F420-1:gamma-L-glutamate ligase
VRVWPLAGLPEIHPGDDLPAQIAELSGVAGVAAGDVLLVAQKVVSKAERRLVELASVTPSAEALALAEVTGKRPQLVHLILSESRQVLRQRGGTLITETHHGFICANAGIDASNVPAGHVLLLPRDPDASARRIQARVASAVGGRVGVIITDTHGRAFRRGLINVAIGVAGMVPIIDHRGELDREGRVLVATDQAIADELAACAGLYMGKASGVAVVVCSDVATQSAPGGVGELLRKPEHDLFRGGDSPAGIVCG